MIFIKRKYKIPKNALVVGNLAVFREQKDLVSWVKAFKVINESMPAVYALIVGAGPKQSEIQELIKALDLEGKIILPGLQTNTEGL